MTRRKFLHKIIQTGLLGLSGLWWLAKRTVPRKFIRAIHTKSYPGSVRPLSKINKNANWSG